MLADWLIAKPQHCSLIVDVVSGPNRETRRAWSLQRWGQHTFSAPKLCVLMTSEHTIDCGSLRILPVSESAEILWRIIIWSESLDGRGRQISEAPYQSARAAILERWRTPENIHHPLVHANNVLDCLFRNVSLPSALMIRKKCLSCRKLSLIIVKSHS